MLGKRTTSHADRMEALLTLASGGKMKRLDVDNLQALSEVADEKGLTLAEFMLRPRKAA